MSVECSRCERSFEALSDLIPGKYWEDFSWRNPSEEEEERQAEDAGWTISGDVVICDDCESELEEMGIDPAYWTQAEENEMLSEMKCA